MKKGKWLALALASSLAVGMLTLFSCGGGGGGGGGTAAVTSRGTVTKVASIEVNGITYDTSASLIEMSEVPSPTEASLKDGMVVEVKGAHVGTAGAAVSVRAEEVLKGPVSAVTTFSLTSLGQTVQVDATTVWATPSTNSIADIAVTDFVEVHGYVVGEGVIQATRVEEKTMLLGYKVKGIVAAVPAPTATTFAIGALTVDHTTADVTDLPAIPVPAGSFVEVESTSLAFDSVNMILTATKVETDDVHGAAGEEVEVEGILSAITGNPLTPPATLLIAGQTVELTAATRYEGGSAADLFVGVWIEAEGRFNAAGAIVADEIEFDDSVQIEGNVATVGTSTITISGLDPIVIQVPDGATLINLASVGALAPGNHVVLTGRGAGGSNVVASELEAIAEVKNDTALQGPLDAAADPNLTILGVTVDTSAVTFQFFNDNDDLPDDVLTRAQFFAAVGPNMVVNVSGTVAGDVVTWTEAEIE